MLNYPRILFTGFALFHTSQACAYLGPGLGAGTLGVIVGLLGSILLAVFAIFWYPIKRQLTRWGLLGKGETADTEEDKVAKEEQGEQ